MGVSKIFIGAGGTAASDFVSLCGYVLSGLHTLDGIILGRPTVLANDWACNVSHCTVVLL